MFEQPFVVDNSKFDRAFGGGPTLHDEGVQWALDWYDARDAT